MSKKKIICFLIAAVILVTNFVLAYNLWLEKEYHKSDINASHSIFVRTFSEFCCDLQMDGDEFNREKQQLQLDMCMDTWKISKFAEKSEFYDLLASLKRISLQDDLTSLLDEDTVIDLNKLCTYLGSEQTYTPNSDLLTNINEELKNILSEIEQ